MRTANNQSRRQPRPALTRRESALLLAASAAGAAGADITSQRFPKMSKAALMFARQMRANRHVQDVMRDLADK